MQHCTKRQRLLTASIPAPDDSPDIISNLPLEVIHSILVQLPIEDAVKTSVLSTNWRSKWLSMPALCFCVNYDYQLDPFTESKLIALPKWSDLASIILHVLLQHVGSVDDFRLDLDSYHGRLQYSDIDRMLIGLCENGIKDISLDCVGCKNALYKIPFFIFHSQELSCLEFTFCNFKVPSIFDSLHNLIALFLVKCNVGVPLEFPGFRRLKELYITHNGCLAKDGGHVRLISKCLEQQFEMLRVWAYGSLPFRVHSPNLWWPNLRGDYEGLSFGSCPLLSSVFLHRWRGSKNRNLIQVLSTFHGIKSLYLSNLFFKVQCICQS